MKIGYFSKTSEGLCMFLNIFLTNQDGKHTQNSVAFGQSWDPPGTPSQKLPSDDGAVATREPKASVHAISGAGKCPHYIERAKSSNSVEFQLRYNCIYLLPCVDWKVHHLKSRSLCRRSKLSATFGTCQIRHLCAAANLLELWPIWPMAAMAHSAIATPSKRGNNDIHNIWLVVGPPL